MSVTTLYDSFVQAQARNTVDAGVLPLMGKLVGALAVTRLTLQDAYVERRVDAALLSAVTTWANGTAWNLKLTGTVDDQGRDTLTLTLLARTPKGFVDLGTLVPEQPYSRRQSPTVGNATQAGPSLLKPFGAEQTSITVVAIDDASATPSLPCLSGWLTLSGTALAPYSAVLGASRLALAGTFDPRAEATGDTKVQLTASAPAASTDWAKMLVESVALSFSTSYADAYSFEDPPAQSSAVLLVLTLEVDTGRPHDVSVSVPLLQNDQLWDIDGVIAPPLTLSDGVAGLCALLPGMAPSSFTLPAGVAALDAFGVSQLRFGVRTSGDALPVPSGIAYTGLTLQSTSPWDLPIPFIRIEEVGASWIVMWGDTQPRWGATLFGTLRFGSKTAQGTTPTTKTITDMQGNPVYLDVVVTLPEQTVSASTRGAITLSLDDAMAVFFPSTQPSTGANLVVDKITMNASLPGKTYGATLNAHGDWEIPVGDVSFRLASISFNVTVDPSQIWGGLAGTASVNVRGEQKALIAAGAYYPGDGSWNFQGGLAAGSLNLTELIAAFLGHTAPLWVPDLALTRLWATYSTAPGNPYSVSAAVAVSWDPEVLGLKLLLTAEADIRWRKKAQGNEGPAARDALLLQSLQHHQPRLYDIATYNTGLNDTPEMIYEGALKGSFQLNNLIITVGLSFLAQEQTWLFRLQLDRFALEARTSWIAEGTKRHQVLTVEMEGVTLGAMIESLAALANPNANYRLEPPWTFLNSIDLGRFSLVIDPTEQSVALNYAIRLNLGFVNITQVGLRYDRKTGEPQVNIEITGTFLGKPYGQEPGMTPLRWDALNDSPPAIPGKGNALVDLHYLGFGQHVALDGLTNPDSLSEVLRLLRSQLKPSVDPGINPLDQPSGNTLHFSENSQWMIGLDITVMGTVSVKLVMHDPDLYGVLIALGGPEAGALAGFSFELLYKKVTDDIGVFHARLQVPDQFRQMDFGAVAITLGIITVDIFTNGNFKIDLGFPHARDYSVSFGVQYGPFLGKGGLYFGLLNGATSTRVPAITNGTFSPVLELGLGLAVGIGREFNKGPLKAGLYAQLEVIFEGVLGWFHPNDAGASKAMYYSVQGTAALVGKVYGKVDFKIISIDVSFEAYAAASLSMAAYRPTLVEMHVGVRVHASIKVLFVRISFSFSTSLDVSFTIGSGSTTPWVLSADQSGRTPGLSNTRDAVSGAKGLLANASMTVAGRRRRPVHIRRLTRQLTQVRLLHAQHPLAAQHQILAAPKTPDPCAVGNYQLQFLSTAKVYPDDAIQTLDVRMVPGFTIAGLPIGWPDSPAPSAVVDPQYRVVVMLAIDGPAPVQPSTFDAARLGEFQATARATTNAETPFAQLAEGLFRWALTALKLDPQTATLSAGDLEELAAQLDCPQTFSEAFCFTNLSGFLGNNFKFNLSGTPAGPMADTLAGVSFAMPPALGWTRADVSAPADTRDFATYQPIDDAYAARIASYFAKLSPQTSATGSVPAGIGSGESLASVIFREYMLLITKSMVQAAQHLFTRFPVHIDGTSTLAGVADIAQFPQVDVSYVMHLGDTLDQIADTYGYSAQELLVLNPTLPENLLTALPGALLTVHLGVTPQSIAAANPQRLLAPSRALHASALQTQVLSAETPAMLCRRVGAVVDTWLGTSDALDSTRLTRAGAPMALPQVGFANTQGLTLVQVAALFYVRINAGTPANAAIAQAHWYAEAISQLNGQAIGADASLPASINLPRTYDVLAAPYVTWARLCGDDLVLLAACTALWQNPTLDPGFAPWWAHVQALNPGYTSGPLQVPAITVQLLPDESLRMLATRILWVNDPIAEPTVPTPAFIQLASTCDLLAPLAQVTVSDCTLVTGPEQTLQAFASTYDLSLETVGHIGATVPGLIVPDPHAPLWVPCPPAMTLATLMPELVDDVPIRDVAGQVSRFMLHGQRLPVPGAAEGSPLAGLFELVGQQIHGPVPDSTQPPDTLRMSLAVNKTLPLDWLQLVSTQTVPADTSSTRFASPDAELIRRNPALAANRLRPGMILETGDLLTLTLAITESQLSHYPAPVLVPALPALPRALPLWADVSVRHCLAQQVIWQTPSRPALPILGSATAVGMPSFWPFSSNLNGLASIADDKPWHLYRTDLQLGPDAPAIDIAEFAWATLLDIRINRIPGRPHTVDVRGADTAGRQRLLELWRYLQSAGTHDSADLFLGFQLSPAAGLAGGLASTPANPDASYLVRTNLSTETRSGNLASRRPRSQKADQTPPSGDYFAPMSEPMGFLTLLWEASVIGGGGYWLDFTDAAGDGFSESIWGPDGNAVISLIVVLESQSSTGANRRLYPFNNAVLLGEPLDASSNLLFVAAPDDRDQRRQATVAPGNVGFTFDINNPLEADDDPGLIARQLYNLAGYQVLENSRFEASHAGRPISPKLHEDTALRSMQMAPSLRTTTDEQQTVTQVIPIHRFAKQSSVPNVPGLPDAALDPYAGIALDDHGQLASARVNLCFHDVFGNTTTPPSADNQGDMP